MRSIIPSGKSHLRGRGLLATRNATIILASSSVMLGSAAMAAAKPPARITSDFWSVQSIQANPLSSNIISLPLNSPPINGFVPQVIMGLTDQENKNDATSSAVASSTPGGNTLPVGGTPHYVIATFDTGSQSHIVTVDEVPNFNFSGANRLGGYTAEVAGAVGSEVADVTDPVGVYASGFANGSVNGGVLSATAGTFNGQWNASILTTQTGSQLPNILGAPIMAQYQAVIRNSQTRRLTVNGQTYRSPQVDFQALDTPLPAGYVRMTFDLQSPSGVAPTPVFVPSLDNFNNFADNPATPTFWSSFFGNVNVSGNGGGATNQQFLFDTGAQVTVLSEDMAAACGFYSAGPNPSTPDFFVEISGVGGSSQNVPGFFLPTLSVLTNGGPMTWTNIPVVVLDLIDPRDGIGFVPGVLGTNLFADRDLIVNGGLTNPSVGISPILTARWTSATGGNWSDDSKWMLGVPDGADLPANFLSDITSPATINVNGNFTLGSMKFDNSKRVTVSGTGTLTMQSSVGPSSIQVLSGSHTISAPMTLASNLAVSVTSASSTLTISSDVSGSGKTLAKSGAGVLEMKNVRLASVSVSAGTLKILANGTSTGTSVVTSVPTFGATGRLDVTNNKMVINYTGASPVNAVRAAILAGRGQSDAFDNGETWNGASGIVSSTASGNVLQFGIGYGENSAMPAGSYTSFGGQTVGSSSILIKYTRNGDTDLNGVVDGGDAGTVGLYYNTPGFGQWYFGDMDYDGIVDGDDAGIIGLLYNPNATPVSAAQLTAQYGADFAAAFEKGRALAASGAVPEPAGLSILGLGSLAMLGRRSKNR